MRIGYDDNGLIRIPIKLGCGIYVRWWYNGWHYWLFTQGETFLVTEGENYFTLGTLKMNIGSRQLDQQQVNAIRSLANTREIYAMTDYGWRTARIEEGSFQVFNNMTGGYDLEFVLIIGARHISLTALSPRISIPVVPPDYAYCELPCIGDQIWACANYDSNYPGSKVYNDDEANRVVYGGLYSWDQIMASGFVPAGWHIPTLAEWQTLIAEAGGAAAAGGALKEIGNTHWSAPNTGAVDTYDFTALPGGYWNTVGAGFFTGINQYARFWTATPGAVGLAYYVRLAYNSAAIVEAQMDKGHFASVRLVKDEECPFAPFMMTVDTTKAGSANDTFILPTTGPGYDAWIDWGDGSVLENISGTPGNVTHVYAAPGTYQIKITGTFPRIYFNNGGDRQKLITIDQWGDIEWATFAGSFFGCINMQGNWSDTPDLSNVTDLFRMFANCSTFNYSVNGWDTSNIMLMNSTFLGCTLFNQPVPWNTANVTDMFGLFASCTAFNQSLPTFNTSNVGNMGSMFFGCSNFNQSLANFDTSNVVNMVQMFLGCIVFNTSIANFDTSEVTDMSSMFSGCTIFNQSVANFDTAKVTRMYQMFYNCINFNQPVANFDTALVEYMHYMFYGCSGFNQSVANFDTSEVTTMREMFRGCTIFNQSVANFDTAKVTDMRNMFYNCSAFKQSLATFNVEAIVNTGYLADICHGCNINSVGTANYDATLVSWAAQTVTSGMLNVDFGTSQYSAAGGGQAARAILTGAPNNWTINDGGLL